MENNVNNVLKSSDECPLLLETPAGVGTELFTKIDDFMNFIKKINHENFGICMDTCHVFASGYDPYEYLCTLIDNNLTPRLIHYNDSKMEKGSKKDRHQFIGLGKIPLRSMYNVFIKAKEFNIPLVYE